jgi:hypothetical protein
MMAEKYGLSKDELDEYSYESHQRAIAATQAGKFNDQRVEHGSGEIGRVPAGKASSLAAACGAGGGDDISLGHDCSP